MRGTTAAISSALAHIISLGIGSAIMGAASDYFTARAYTAAGGIGSFSEHCISDRALAVQDLCEKASGTGLRFGMMAAAVFLVWASVHFFLASRTIRGRFGEAAGNADQPAAA